MSCQDRSSNSRPLHSSTDVSCINALFDTMHTRALYNLSLWPSMLHASQCAHATHASSRTWPGTAHASMTCLAQQMASQWCLCTAHSLAGSAWWWRPEPWLMRATGAWRTSPAAAHSCFLQGQPGSWSGPGGQLLFTAVPSHAILAPSRRRTCCVVCCEATPLFYEHHHSANCRNLLLLNTRGHRSFVRVKQQSCAARQQSTMAMCACTAG